MKQKWWNWINVTTRALVSAALNVMSTTWVALFFQIRAQKERHSLHFRMSAKRAQKLLFKKKTINVQENSLFSLNIYFWLHGYTIPCIIQNCRNEDVLGIFFERKKSAESFFVSAKCCSWALARALLIIVYPLMPLIIM